jgi:putative transposase
VVGSSIGQHLARLGRQAGCGRWRSVDAVGLPNNQSIGGCYQAGVESLADQIKAEVIYRRICKTREPVELATLTWVSWLNNHRLMRQLGYIPLAEAKANYWNQLAEQSAPLA